MNSPTSTLPSPSTSRGTPLLSTWRAGAASRSKTLVPEALTFVENGSVPVAVAVLDTDPEFRSVWFGVYVAVQVIS